ncbi:MAG: M23 family metallopeptidase [Actinomycetaceae bacterium]|nr:M23 family metallopeptidase [Actinomycetaceae bacterium]
MSSGTQARCGDYIWPTGTPVEVPRRFDPPAQPWLPGHRGVDLALDVGSAVVAAKDGVVAFAGTVVDRPLVSIDHDDGKRSTYEPIEPVVAEGDEVFAGDTIGFLVEGHGWEGPALHFGIRVSQKEYEDPLWHLCANIVLKYG